MVPFGFLHPAYGRYISKRYIDKCGDVIPYCRLWNKLTLTIEGKKVNSTSGFYPTGILVDNGISFEDNTADEILSSVMEFEKLVFDRKLDQQLTSLQHKYLDSIPEVALMKNSASVLTDAFIRKNLALFNLSEESSE